MIPVKVYEGKLFDKLGNEVKPENGLIQIEVSGKMKRFVFNKLVDYLERNGQVYKKPILKRFKAKKAKVKKIPKPRPKTGTVGHHRRRKVIVTDLEGNIKEFESIIQASNELKICRSKIFSVLNGRLKSLKGYKIKYAV